MSVLYTSGGEYFENVRQVLAAPEHLSVEHEYWSAEHAIRLRRLTDGHDLGQSGGQERGESSAISTGRSLFGGQRTDVLDVEGALSEAIENRVVIGESSSDPPAEHTAFRWRPGRNP
ncbi:MAG TPA: hypothetical protein VGM42_07660 [Rhodopila sp.]|jgi:hypothetical protein